MIESSNVAYYEASPRSRKELRRFAKDIRCLIGVQKQARFPIMKFLEFVMPYKFGVEKKIIDDDLWNKRYKSNIHASFNLNEMIIEIKESIYNGACLGNGRDRMTIAHEVGHALLLPKDNIKLYRSLKGERPPAFKDPEWQAKCFGGELLVNYEVCRGMSVGQIVEQCQVSFDAAAMQRKFI